MTDSDSKVTYIRARGKLETIIQTIHLGMGRLTELSSLALRFKTAVFTAGQTSHDRHR